jgi:hypothetical protein
MNRSISCAISKASDASPAQQVAARLAEACNHPSHAFWPQQVPGATAGHLLEIPTNGVDGDRARGG